MGVLNLLLWHFALPKRPKATLPLLLPACAAVLLLLLLAPLLLAALLLLPGLSPAVVLLVALLPALLGLDVPLPAVVLAMLKLLPLLLLVKGTRELSGEDSRMPRALWHVLCAVGKSFSFHCSSTNCVYTVMCWELSPH